jgi:hypothetical protein
MEVEQAGAVRDETTATTAAPTAPTAAASPPGKVPAARRGRPAKKQGFGRPKHSHWVMDDGVTVWPKVCWDSAGRWAAAAAAAVAVAVAAVCQGCFV